MFEFCPHCGSKPGGQDLAPGQRLICQSCGHEIGIVPPLTKKIIIDRAEEILASGTAGRCPVCSQLVPVKTTDAGRSLVPHLGQGETRQMCPGSGKPVAAGASATPGPEALGAMPTATAANRPAGRDLSAYMHREQIQVVACRRDTAPTIEVLSLEYLDKADRVRLQIDALRDILGKSFQMKPYPSLLNRPQLAVWSNADGCVVGKKHAQGGYQSLSAEEVAQVVKDLGGQRSLFYK